MAPIVPLLQFIASSSILTTIAIVAATYLIWGVFLFAVITVVRSNAITAVYSMVIAISGVWLFQQLIGTWWFRARPFVEDQRISNLINKSALSKSFPSDHAAIAFAIATSVYLVLPSWGKILYVCALMIGLGRVAVGVHYPSDVVVGALLGTISAIIVHWIIYRV